MLRVLWIGICCLLASSALADLPPKPLVTLDQVEQLTQTQKIASLEQLLAGLPKQLGQRVTLIHTSRSRQGSSFEYPRAILYGPDAQFVLSFNGHPSQANYNSIEMFQFDSAAGRFHFATVELPEQPGGRAVFNRDASRCTGCHGQSEDRLHPIWDPYFLWRGAYGGIDDNLKPSSSGSYLTDELGKYRAFIRNVKSNPAYSRYAALPFDPALETPPYGNEGGGNFYQRPNFGFIAALSRLNARRVAAEILSAPGWADKNLRKRIAGLLVKRDPTLLDPGFEAAAQKEAQAFYSSISSSFRLRYPPGSSYVGNEIFVMQAAALLGIPGNSMLLGKNDEFSNVYEGSAADFHSYVVARVLEGLGGAPRLEELLAGYEDTKDFTYLGMSAKKFSSAEIERWMGLISGSL